jgi:hypothetical protein
MSDAERGAPGAKPAGAAEARCHWMGACCPIDVKIAQPPRSVQCLFPALAMHFLHGRHPRTANSVTRQTATRCRRGLPAPLRKGAPLDGATGRSTRGNLASRVAEPGLDSPHDAMQNGHRGDSDQAFRTGPCPMRHGRPGDPAWRRHKRVTRHGSPIAQALVGSRHASSGTSRAVRGPSTTDDGARGWHIGGRGQHDRLQLEPEYDRCRHCHERYLATHDA